MRLEPAPAVHVVEPHEGLRERAAASGATAVGAVADLPAGFSPDVVVLAVKPQMMAQVLPGYTGWSGGKTTFVSVAAGMPIAFIEAALPGATPVVRCMPNTPAAIGAGVMAACVNAHVGADQLALANTLLGAGGMVVDIPDEKMMDMVTAVSGSGPAYLFHFVEALTSAAIKVGLPEELAGKIALQTIHGAARLAAESGEPAAVLRKNVTSPGGTTAAALGVLMDKDALTELVGEAVTAAHARAFELGKTN